MKIGFTGAFGDSNFGDYAMLINDIYDIDENDITIFTYNKELLNDMKEEYLHDYNISICEIKTKQRELNLKEGKEYTVQYDSYPKIPLEMLAHIENLEELKEEISKIDKLVVVGGGYFTHVWNALHRQDKLMSIIAPILIANRYKKDIIFLGNTYGPFLESNEMYANFFNYLDNPILGTRDDLYSRSNMRKIGVSQEMFTIPDDLYFLNKKIKANNYNSNEEYVVLELYPSIKDIEENKDIIKKFLNTIENKYNLKVVFLPFDRRFGGEYQADEIKKIDNNIEIFKLYDDKFQKIEDVLGVVKNAKFVLCHRYHLFLFSLANNTPVINLLKDVNNDKRYYYCKSNGILKEVFKNQIYDEELFLGLSLNETLENISNNLESIIDKQKELFNNKKVECEKQYKEKRKNLINSYIKK